VSQVIIAHKGDSGAVEYLSTIARDITLRKEHENRITRLNRVYAVLSGINTTIVRTRSRQELFDEACRIAVEEGRFRLAWIGLLEPDGAGIVPVARAGLDEGYLDGLRLSALDDSPDSLKLVTRVMREKAAVVCNDIDSDSRMARWREEALRRGYRSLVVLPLQVEEKVLGVLLLYASEKDFFDTEEMRLLTEVAGDISFALDNFKREAVRERAEQALGESEARFRSLTEMSSDFYWETDAEHRFTQGNSAANLSVQSVWRTQIGKRRWDTPYLSPDEAGWQAHRAVLDAHRPFREFELSRLDTDGTEHHLSVSGDPIFDASGAFMGYRGVGTDITERKRAELALRAAEGQFRGLVEQSIAGTYIIQDGRFAYVNRRCAEIFGYDSADEMIGREASSLVAENERNTVAEDVRRLSKGGTASVSYEFTGVRKNGSTIDVGVHGARATHCGRPAVIGLIQDISEKKRAEEQIRRYVAQLETAFMSTVQVAMTLSEMRDPYTAGHERRVAEIAVAIGAELGFDSRRLEGLRVAGYLHDIGKITIPSEILSKPGRLTAIEFKLIQGHPQASHDVLKAVEFPWPVAGVALQHHERIDGSGYPQGLKGEAILFEARIMAVADVVEAMSSHRPYRPGLGIDKALAEIERGRGTVYDANVADACARLFGEKGYSIPA
jgi:PAS domain S-box-containing protein